MSYYIDNDEYIYINPNSIDNYVCDYIIELFENGASHLVYRGVVVGNNTPDMKKTRDLKLTPSINKYDTLLFTELEKNINEYFNGLKYKKILPSIKNINDSGYQVQKYLAKTGIYEYHHDSHFKTDNNSNIQTRLLTFIWYLNTVEEGGETEFFNGRLKVKPEKGKLLIFPATWTYMHKGNMPLSNDKYIVTGWIWVDIWI
jgi:hypothetical protein